MASERPSQREVTDATAATEAAMRPQRVPVNAYETSGAFVLIAPMPAVTIDDVTVELDGGLLRFWAHLRSAGPRQYLIQEWAYGGYEREVAVPEGFGRGVEASLANGQLVVRVLRGEPSESVTVKPTATAATSAP